MFQRSISFVSTTSIQLVDLLLKNYDQVLTREGPLSNAYRGAYIMPDWLPDILTITFNRTAVSASDQAIKVKTQVDFPILLGMENICRNAKNMAGKLQYKLRFAVVHDGSSIHGGMYFHSMYITACILNCSTPKIPDLQDTLEAVFENSLHARAIR